MGLVSRGDLVRAFARSDEEIQREIEEDVLRRVMWLDPSDVSVAVSDGMVTLTGQVATAADADLLPGSLAGAGRRRCRVVADGPRLEHRVTSTSRRARTPRRRRSAAR